MQEVMTVANDTKNVFRGTVAAEDVLRAYETGDEVSLFVGSVLLVVLTFVPFTRGCMCGGWRASGLTKRFCEIS